MSHNRTVSPAVAGSYYRGTRVEDRSVFWPLYLFHDGTAQDWIAHNRRFWSALRPTETSVWRVVQPTSEARYLDVRYESGGDEPYEVDPAFSGWTLHGLGLVADKPYWRGDPITRDFDSPESTRSNFGPPGVLHIYAGSSFDTATITNPGDLAVRVTWVLRGPLDSAKVGVGNKTIDVPFPIAAGSTLTIYTDDDLMLALDEDGVDRTGALGPTTDMTGVVAPGGDGALSVRPVWSAVGGGVSAVLTPLFYMAF
jgi:hypothetical protein